MWRRERFFTGSNGALSNMDMRKTEEAVAKTAMLGATAAIIGGLFLILATMVIKGLPAMNLAMITQTPKGGFYLGKEGGILNAIVGSLCIVGVATALAVLVAVPVALYLSVYSRRTSQMARFARFSLEVLWGVPSIVYGAFGFTVMLLLGLRASLLGGSIAVFLLILPIMSRAMDETLRLVPKGLTDAALALGATRLEAATGVVLRQALPGIITAILIAVGRGIGDAASVLFTAGFTDNLPTSLFQPAATLPLAIFFQLGSPIPEVQERAYASALVLTIIILAISTATRLIARRFSVHRVL
jgi:phosphate transport system permease protein